MEHPDINFNKFSFYIALATTFLTIITFSIAISTPPLSGPFCKAGCFEYPYLDIASRFPRDYYWMFAALLLFSVFPVLMVCIHFFTSPDRKFFSFLGVVFSSFSSVILLTNYFLQVSVIQISLINNETDGVSILSQFNPHGIFIALEELGFILMSVSLFLTAFSFNKKNSLENSIRWIYILNFILGMLFLALILFVFGLKREVITISLNWLSLIISGTLLSRLFYREMYKQRKLLNKS